MDKQLVDELLFEIIEKICWIKNIVNYDKKCKHGYYVYLPKGSKTPCGCKEEEE